MQVEKRVFDCLLAFCGDIGKDGRVVEYANDPVPVSRLAIGAKKWRKFTVPEVTFFLLR